MNRFSEFYKNEKDLINKELDEFNKKLIIEDNKIIKDNLELFKTLNSDGKLIRGSLVNLGYYLLKDNKEYSNSLSLAYEIFQTAILVHDDIIDNDNKRRGKDTIHYANYEKYKKYSSDELEVKKLGNSIAICMGDYGLYQANKLVADAYKDDKNLGKVLSYFNEIVLKTIKGELLDVVLPFTSKYNLTKNEHLEDNIMNIYRLKTSYYTIIGPLASGLLLAGATNDKVEDITKFGELVGIAFQIQDDILGIYSNEMGKVKGSDIKEFKQTILYSYTCNTEFKDKLLKYYGSEELTEKEIEEVQEIFKVSGALDYAKTTMNKMYDSSLDILENITWITKDKKEILTGFVEYLRLRNK